MNRSKIVGLEDRDMGMVLGMGDYYSKSALL